MRPGTVALVLFALVATGAYLALSLKQRETINLSATAGGQFPYLINAKQMAVEGRLTYWGDRNRTPLYPMLLSTVHNHRWDVFVGRSSTFAIVSSILMLAALAWHAYAKLSRTSASLFLVIAAFHVFLPKASFVQAELLYYTLLFFFWYGGCKILNSGGRWQGLIVGLLGGFAFLAKASALLMFAVLVVLLVIKILFATRFMPSRVTGARVAKTRNSRFGSTAITLATVLVGFVLVAGPYLADNNAKFGKYLYNVNSRFFMWCDSWGEAKRFADRYDISNQYPAAATEEIPGPLNYLRTHSLSQAGKRLTHGFNALAKLGIANGAIRYTVLLAIGILITIALDGGVRRRIGTQLALPLAFTAVSGVGYVLVYSWFALVAYGDRFILSLCLPILFAVLTLYQTQGRVATFSIAKMAKFASRLVQILLCLCLVETAVLAAPRSITASPTFVRFYMNESRQRERVGDQSEAYRGYLGVAQLDPNHADARLAAGMLDLRARRFESAVELLSRAAQLEPSNADILNSYGSALIQVGKHEDAIPVLQTATQIHAGFAPAWYNLCGALMQTGHSADARAALAQLQAIDPDMARSLAGMLSEHE